jgi:hypothetical protein
MYLSYQLLQDILMKVVWKTNIAILFSNSVEFIVF